MRKSAAITASPSTTRLTARLSGTNQLGEIRVEAGLDLGRLGGLDPHQARGQHLARRRGQPVGREQVEHLAENGLVATPSANSV